jgi:hypothetical protein
MSSDGQHPCMAGLVTATSSVLGEMATFGDLGVTVSDRGPHRHGQALGSEQSQHADNDVEPVRVMWVEPEQGRGGGGQHDGCHRDHRWCGFDGEGRTEGERAVVAWSGGGLPVLVGCAVGVRGRHPIPFGDDDTG